jgi:MFS family permease
LVNHLKEGVAWGLLPIFFAEQGLELRQIARLAAAVVLGIGTAADYPTLIAQAGDLVAPKTRASAIGLYRLWRDLGYVVGALLAGLLTDLLSFRATILIIAVLLVGSSLTALVLLPARSSSRRLARAEA